jgi:hypothetical protein
MVYMHECTTIDTDSIIDRQLEEYKCNCIEYTEDLILWEGVKERLQNMNSYEYHSGALLTAVKTEGRDVIRKQWSWSESASCIAD